MPYRHGPTQKNNTYPTGVQLEELDRAEHYDPAKYDAVKAEYDEQSRELLERLDQVVHSLTRIANALELKANLALRAWRER